MKETIDVFEILGEKNNTQLEISKILSDQKNDSQLDVSKILKHDLKQNQEHSIAPDFDLSSAIRHIGAPAPAPKPAPELKPAPKPAPEPVQKPPSELKPVSETEPKPGQKPVPKPASEPKPAPSPAPAQNSKRTPAPRPDKKPRSRRIIKLAVKAAVTVAALIFITAFVFSGFIITDNAMAPTISKGDVVLVNKMTKSYHSGDIIMFRDSHEQKHFLRIVAAEGDLIDIRKDGKLYINSKAEDENYVTGETLKSDENILYPFLVSEDEFFIMGDNRENSTDSRDYQIGTVREDEIVGKVIFCIKKIK